MPREKIYDTYLFEQGYARSTIDSYLNAQSKFTQWYDYNSYDPCYIDYKTCLLYVKDIQRPSKGKQLSKRSVSHQVGPLKIYFNYLIDENYRGNNPFQNINIRGVGRSINHNLLEYVELEDLFYSYKTHNIELPNCPHVAILDKVVIGLMVYQGLDAKALMSLKMEHILLEKGKIYIPSIRKTNVRELELKSPQMLSLHCIYKMIELYYRIRYDATRTIYFPVTVIVQGYFCTHFPNALEPSITKSRMPNRLEHLSLPNG
jgi:integrase/recombinase XerD